MPGQRRDESPAGARRGAARRTPSHGAVAVRPSAAPAVERSAPRLRRDHARRDARTSTARTSSAGRAARRRTTCGRRPPRPPARSPTPRRTAVAGAGRGSAGELARADAATTNGPTSSRVRRARGVPGARARPPPAAATRAGRPPRRRRDPRERGDPESSALPQPTAAGPRVRVDAVVGGRRSLTEVERAEGVDHDRELVEELHADADRSYRAGLRPVRVAARVQRDRALR